jgi:tRNA (adenine22-N1)-methyltransferase
MNFSREGEDSLSLRLAKMRSFYSTEEHIWDIGCDHGLLGLSFQNMINVKSINLVDFSIDVIRTLKKTIDSHIPKGNVFIHHTSGQEINIKNESNCIFIAGMGGKEIGEIIQHLLPQVGPTSQFVISPHRKILELRALLRTFQIHLKIETLVFENQQFYQVLVLKPGEGKRVGLYGEDIWKGALGRDYLEHQKLHFSQHRDQASREYLAYLQSL